MNTRLMRKVGFDIREEPTDRLTPIRVTCRVCGGVPFAIVRNMTEANASKGEHRKKHALAAGPGARDPQPLVEEQR